ncbi:MAG: hypothetical protein K0U98_18060 [Deltaproteobacteria bacterium]|nr:hypothetical protein [Deltaproteobacteria bacterium]
MNNGYGFFWILGLLMIFAVAFLGNASSDPESTLQVYDPAALARSESPTGLDTEPAPGLATFELSYDDGEADAAYGGDALGTVEMAMRFDLTRFPAGVEEVSVCLLRATAGGSSSLSFDLVFWEANGTGGTPGDFLARLPVTATGVPAAQAGAFYTYDVSLLDLEVTENRVFLGVRWDATTDPGFFLCGDRDGATPQPAFNRISQTGTWIPLATTDPGYRALMIRGVFSGEASGPCTEGASTLCLNNDRFRVEADFLTPGGNMGPAQAVELTDDTGYFWFFNSTNVEMVIKVLRGCGNNGHYWVFAGGLTNVQVDLTVTDTQTGDSQIYRNPLQTQFQPIQDTGAFSSCP